MQYNVDVWIYIMYVAFRAQLLFLAFLYGPHSKQEKDSTVK